MDRPRHGGRLRGLLRRADRDAAHGRRDPGRHGRRLEPELGRCRLRGADADRSGCRPCIDAAEKPGGILQRGRVLRLHRKDLSIAGVTWL